jgi:hypothetical protein
MFWRSQIQDASYLATIEAIYYFFREWSTFSSGDSLGNDGDYDGRFDNLLLFYKFFYDLIGREASQTQRKRPVDDIE